MQSADRRLKDVGHQRVARFTAWDRVAAIHKPRFIGQINLFIVEVVSAENPIWQNVVLIELGFLRANTADKTAVPLDDVAYESLDAEKEHFTVLIQDGPI